MERTASCPSCRRGIFVDDEFCAWCGTAILSDTVKNDGPTREDANAAIGPVDRLTCGSCNHQVLPGDLFCAACGARYATGEEEADGIGESVSTIAQRVMEASDGRYEVIRLLGRGGMGVVLMARDLDLGRLVAIKALAPSWLSDESMVGRFQREARTIASLRHESIVSVYDRGRAGEYYYFVMDFIEGVPLSEIIRSGGPLSVPVVQAVLYQVGSALDYAHGRAPPIVHRDIKPANIMLDSDGLAVVMDFGISKVSESASGLTRTGIVMGTPEYMSPEQCRGPTVTHESDQYSLGAVAFAMLTGAPPFTGPYYQVLMAHQSEPVRPLVEVRPDCPSELASAVERMLAKVPGDRWPTIGDMLHELGLRPLPRGNPAREEIGRLVRGVQEHSKRGRGTPSGGAAAGFTRTPTSLRIEPRPSGLEVGDDVALSAVMLFPDGDEEAGDGVSWESTDPSIARIDPDSGRLVAVGAGSVEIRAAVGTVSESVSVSVSPPRVVRVTIEPESPRIEVGSTLRLQARASTKRDEALQRPVSWSSSDPRTASVDDQGRVTAHRGGTASILAHCEGVGGATQLTVEAPAPVPAGADDETRVAPAAAASLAETVAMDSLYPPGPSTRDDTPPGAGKSRPEPTPATGPRAPLPLLLGVGAVALLMLVGWWALGALVGGASVQELRLTGDGSELGQFMTAAVGDTIAFSATALDADGNVVDEDIEWSSDDPAVASFLGGGRLVAAGEGTTRVRARAGDVERPLSLSIGPAVASGDEPDEPGAVARITLRRSADGSEVTGPLGVRPGETVRLRADPLDDAGRDVPETIVLWESTAPGVAAVDSRGTVTGLQDGRTDIVASAGGVERRIQVRVTAPAPPPTQRTPETGPAQAPPRDPAPDGTLQLVIQPYGNVWIDGAQVATEQSRFSRALSPGSHRLRIERAGAQPFDTTVTIRSGQITRISKSLNRQDP